jgi:chromate transporter
VDGVTAAAVGAIAGAVCVLGKRQLADWAAVVIAVVTMVILLRFRKIPEPFVILAAAIIGLIIKNYL